MRMKMVYIGMEAENDLMIAKIRYRIDKVLSDLPDDKAVELAKIVERIAEMQH